MGFLGISFFMKSALPKRPTCVCQSDRFCTLVAAGLAFIPNVANLWSTWEYGKQTMRGGGSQLAEKKKTNTGGGLDIEYANPLERRCRRF